MGGIIKGRRLTHRESEPERRSKDVLLAFVLNKDSILEKWNEPPKRASTAKKSKAEVNEEVARKNLARWETKLKLAKTKVAVYKKKVDYYDKRRLEGKIS